MELKTYTVRAHYVNLTGRLFPARYADGRWALAIEDEGRPEKLSVNLAEYGFKQPAGYVYVKNYSEHEGLVAALEEAGIAKKVGEPISFGPYDGSAWLMELTPEVVEQYKAAGAV